MADNVGLTGHSTSLLTAYDQQPDKITSRSAEMLVTFTNGGKIDMRIPLCIRRVPFLGMLVLHISIGRNPYTKFQQILYDVSMKKVLITDGVGYWAGDRIHRNPKNRREIISMWTTQVSNAHDFVEHSIAEYYIREIGIKGLTVTTR